MYKEEVQVICPQILQCLVESTLNILGVMFRVPELSRNKDIGARDAALSNALSHGRLVAVDGCSVYMAVARLEGCLDRLHDLIIGCLPCAKSHSGDLGTGVEGEMCRERHCVLVDARWLQLGVAWASKLGERCLGLARKAARIAGS